MSLTGVTITGADDAVEMSELAKLSNEFPFVEWGILISSSRAGTPRYPSIDWCERLRCWANQNHLRRSAHLCGHVMRVTQEGSDAWTSLLQRFGFGRVQLNGVGFDWSLADTLREAFRDYLVGSEIILQARAEEHIQPAADLVSLLRSQSNASILFDPSGGRGIEAFKWPRSPGVRMGYAGGIKPENVVDVIQRIYEDSGLLGGDFWIDMETGVRDEHDRFDLARVRAVLEKAAPFVKAAGGAP